MNYKQSLRQLIVRLFIFGTITSLQAQSILLNNGSQLIVESGSMLIIQGDIINTTSGNDAIKLSGEIRVSGDFTNNAASGNLFTSTTGTVVLNGNNTQTIGGSQSIYFNNMEANNSNGGIIIDKDCFIGGVLTLSDGLITTTSSKELNMLAGSSISGGSDASHIDGPMTKAGNTDFTFPVGNGGFIHRLALRI